MTWTVVKADSVIIAPWQIVKDASFKVATKIGWVGAIVMCAAPVSLHWLPAQAPSLTVDKANAVIGRPGTPGSVAGVHRRAHRRAYRHGYHY